MHYANMQSPKSYFSELLAFSKFAYSLERRVLNQAYGNLKTA